MASEITHIVYAKRYLDKLEGGELNGQLSEEEKVLNPPKKIDRDEFILGCVFPDIRRIDKNISRKDTHMAFEKVDLNFSGLTSFQAGWKFHLYCDMRREEILNANQFYSLKHATDFDNGVAKWLEDELVYEEYNNWEKLNYYFNHPPVIPLDVNVSQESFELWYAIIARYIEKKPDDASIRALLSKQPKLQDQVDLIIASLTILRTNKKAVEILGRVHQEIV